RNARFNNITVNTAGSNAVNVTRTAGASDVRFTDLTIESAGNVGVNILADGAGEFDITLDNADISGVGEQGILLDTGVNNVGRVDFFLTDSTVSATSNSAFEAVLDEGLGNLRFLIQDNDLTSDNATDAT